MLQRMPSEGSLDLEEKDVNPVHLKYSYTPHSKELAEASNAVVLETKKDGWLVRPEKGKEKRGQLLLDVNRDTLVDGRSYMNRPPREQQAAIDQLIRNAYPAVSRKSSQLRGLAERLDSDHNQSLMSYPVALFVYGVFQFSVLIEAQHRKENLFSAGKNIYFRTEHEGFLYRDVIKPEDRLYIPGRIEVAYKWDPQKGFAVEGLGFSNEFLKTVALHNRNGKALDDDELREGIKKAYLEEIEEILKGCKNGAERNILLEMQRLCQENLINLSVPGNARVFWLAYTVVRDRIYSPEVNNNEAYSELASSRLFSSRFPELKTLVDGITPFSVKFKKTVNNNPRKFLALVGGLVLAAVGVALAATGILAPLGVALGWAGLSVAAPGAVAAVGAICFALPAVVATLAIGLVRGLKALASCICSPFRPRSSEPVVKDRSVQGVNTARVAVSVVEQSKSQAEADKSKGLVRVSMHSSPEITREAIALLRPSDDVVDVADNLGSVVRSADKVLAATAPLQREKQPTGDPSLVRVTDVVARSSHL